MKRACIAVVDATRARIYTYQDLAELSPTEQLREEIDLVNPGRRLRPSELFSTTRPGSDQVGRAENVRRYTYDDHRDAHIEAMDAQFAREIVGELERLVRAGGYAHVIVVASPKMLGELRRADGVLHRSGITLDEVPRDLAKLTSPQLHDHLASHGLIPPRQRLDASGARRDAR